MTNAEEILNKMEQLGRQVHAVVKTTSELQVLLSKELLTQNRQTDKGHKH